MSFLGSLTLYHVPSHEPFTDSLISRIYIRVYVVYMVGDGSSRQVAPPSLNPLNVAHN